ncbi:MAG TPA: hypothetical protein VIM29_03300 [Bacillota bacterium]
MNKSFTTPKPDVKYNIENILASALVARLLVVPSSVITEVVQNFTGGNTVCNLFVN